MAGGRGCGRLRVGSFCAAAWADSVKVPRILVGRRAHSAAPRTAVVICALDRTAKFSGLFVQSFSQEQKGLNDFKAFCTLLGFKGVELGKPCCVTRPGNVPVDVEIQEGG